MFADIATLAQPCIYVTFATVTSDVFQGGREIVRCRKAQQRCIEDGGNVLRVNLRQLSGGRANLGCGIIACCGSKV